MSKLTSDDMKKLSEPFDKATICVKVKSFSKDKTKAMLICYVQHTDAYARIEQVDPSWSSEVTNENVVGESVYVRVRLTIKGVTRENVGEGFDAKSATSDAIKRAAMLFGVGRYLYDTEGVWIEYNEQRDRYRSFTFDDYEKTRRRDQAVVPTGPVAVVSTPVSVVSPKVVVKPNRQVLGAEIVKARAQLGLSVLEMTSWIKDRYNKTQAQMTDDEMDDFLGVLLGEIGRNGVAQ